MNRDISDKLFVVCNGAFLKLIKKEKKNNAQIVPTMTNMEK